MAHHVDLTGPLAVLEVHPEHVVGHIDPDLFDVFVKEGVYLRYARQFLDPSQMDEVNPQAWSVP